MRRKRAFRPSIDDGVDRLETRAATSHVGGVHLVMAPLARLRHQLGGLPRAEAAALRRALRFGAFGNRFGLRPRPNAPAASNPVAFAPKWKAMPASAPIATTPASLSPPQNTPPPQSTATDPAKTGVMSSQEQAIVDLVNQERQQAGLSPLQVDSRLVKAAQLHSANMAALGEMEHVLPGSSLPSPESRAQYVGYNYSRLGENIAFNYLGADAVMKGWMNSPGHRANILNPDFTQIGVGIAHDSQGQPYYTQAFGRPA